jgi:hypothetical protein
LGVLDRIESVSRATALGQVGLPDMGRGAEAWAGLPLMLLAGNQRARLLSQ